MEGAVVATEYYGSAETWNYITSDGQIKRRRDDGGGRSVFAVFKSVFLPQGFPESVSEDYLQYQFWDTVQAFSSSLSGTLSTQAALKGVGVGNQEATVAAATVTWLLKDGTGMLGRILFAWLKGSKLDSEAKKWRLFADILNDFAMFMEISAPYFPPFFVVILCIAGIFKSIVGVAGGATRAALTVHQARRDNMADISAKDGSQETLVNLAGLLVSLILVPLVTDNLLLTLGLFFIFTALHLYANYKAVRSVVMETFNEARLSIALQSFLSDKRVLSPPDVNRREPVFLEFGRNVPIRLGVRLEDIAQSLEELDLATHGKHLPYLMSIRKGCVCVCLSPGASVHHEIRAMCQALWLRDEFKTSGAAQDHWKLVHDSQKKMDAVFDDFLKGAEAAGWDVKRTLLDWDEWRVEWKTKSS
ncbi:RUS family member 1 [Gouania willdenowi]|uniref:Uncharacterized protein n=1 Tax=Gouania willdenowi TaxID=441366 RepID=A0A8C5EDV8_GOUWI|nr:RUS1 family protein C16orf58 homolog [Gouania willdenowi]